MPSPLRTRVIEYADPCARSLREHVKVNPKISHVLNLTADQLQRIGVLGSQLAVIDGVASRQSVCPKQLGTVNFKNFRRHERRRVRLARGYLVSSLLIYLHQGGSHAETHLAIKESCFLGFPWSLGALERCHQACAEPT